MQIDMIQEPEFTDGVVAAGEVVGGILLTGDKLLRVEELAVGTRADLIDHGRLQVDLRNSKLKSIAYPLPQCKTKKRRGEGTTQQDSERTKRSQQKAPQSDQVALQERINAARKRSTGTNTVRGTCLPAPVSEKNVLNASSPPPIVLSDGIWPSG